MTDDTSDGGREDDARSSFGVGTSDDDARSLDALFEVVSDGRSRRVLSMLESASVDVMELDAIVDRVVEREVEEGLVSDSEAHRQRVAIALHHNRLPKLDDVAVIDYDARSKTVRYWGDDAVSAFLELCESDDRN